jgi:hypothetical protein
MNTEPIIAFLRLERLIFPGGFMTYKLDNPIPFDEAEDWVKINLPGWDIINGSRYNPREFDD